MAKIAKTSRRTKYGKKSSVSGVLNRRVGIGCLTMDLAGKRWSLTRNGRNRTRTKRTVKVDRKEVVNPKEE
jgi:hypothetical protein